MSHLNPKSPRDLMVRVETDHDESAYGWVIQTCKHTLTLQVPEKDTDRPGWVVTVPWDQITALHDVTEFMTIGPTWARTKAV